MKRQTNEEPLKDVIERFLKMYQLEDGYSEMEISREWKDLMGPGITKYTESLQLKKGVLTIRLSSASLRQELSYAKEKIKERLNSALSSVVIERVEIR